MTKLELLFKDISLRYRIPYPVIEKIYKAEFKFLREKLSEGDKKNPDSLNIVYLRKFGRFVPDYYKMKRVEEMIEKMKLKKDNDERKEI